MENSENEIILNVEDELVKKQRLRSIHIMYFTTFVGSIMFSITIPSMAFYLNDLEHKNQASIPSNFLNATSSYGFHSLGELLSTSSSDPNEKSCFLGYFIDTDNRYIFAAFPFGQLFASPLAGWWYNHRNAREPVIISLFITMVANLLYALAQNKYILLVARLIIGIGASNANIARAYVSKAARSEELSKMMALVSASQAAGFIIGPSIGMIFCNVKWKIYSSYTFDKNTSPGYISILLALLNLIPLVFGYHEFSSGVERKKLQKEKEALQPQEKMNLKDEKEFIIDEKQPLLLQTEQVDIESQSGRTTPSELLQTTSNYDRMSAFVLNIVFFFIVFGFSVFETILTLFTKQNFKWDVMENAGLFVASGFITVCSLLCIKPLQNLGAKIRLKKQNELDQIVNLNFLEDIRVYLLLGLILMTLSMVNGMSLFYKPPISIAQFLVSALVFFSPGFPVAQTSAFILYSKILGPGDHGIMMGLQTAIGCASRIVAPIYATALYDIEPMIEHPNGGYFRTGKYLWISTTLMMLVAILLVLIFHKRFISNIHK